jgi:hypothetical protein
MTVVIARPPSCRRHNNGWFTMRPTSRNGMIFSANYDLEFRGWLRWAAESGNAAASVRTVAEADSLLDFTADNHYPLR